ncbi:MAG: hypothetical protein O6930_00545 [Gammaproteobacteria bacterium]|nr:hypothetical protein [Gammaproteobacteria bacterium]
MIELRRFTFEISDYQVEPAAPFAKRRFWVGEQAPDAAKFWELERAALAAINQIGLQ